MTLYKKEITMNKSKLGPNSVFSGFYSSSVIDENYVDEYTGKILDAQNRQLDPLKYDLADWINKTLGIHYMTGDNFFKQLENGAILCFLAQVIKAKAKIAIAAGYTNKPLPKMGKQYFENAMSGSFFARDNMENFITFCRSMGIHENLVFESDDLVLHTQPRNVILCLLEVARVSTNYGIEPPNLIQLEKEIIEEEAKITLQSDLQQSQLCWQFQSLPSRFECETIRCSSPTMIEPMVYKKWCARNQLTPYHNMSTNTEEITTTNLLSLPALTSSVEVSDTDQSSKCSSKDDSHICFGTKLINESDKTFDELDRKVEQAAQLLHLNCKCANRRYVKLKIRKIGEGKYTIAGRNVLVRLLKSRHMMVRVGGGWDTLDHFLQRHDPCQVQSHQDVLYSYFILIYNCPVKALIENDKELKTLTRRIQDLYQADWFPTCLKNIHTTARLKKYYDLERAPFKETSIFDTNTLSY